MLSELLYGIANRLCIWADKLEPRETLWQPSTLNGEPVSAMNTVVFSAGERGRVLGADGMWHEVHAQDFAWTPRIVE